MSNENQMPYQKRSIGESHAARMIANEQANIRRIDREIESPAGYHPERLWSLREERKHHEKTIEKIQKEFRLNERESNVK